MATNRYESAFSGRYASPEMQYLFSSDMKFSTWRRLWLSLAKAEKAMGLDITDEQIAELEAHLDDIDYVLNGLLKIGFDEVYEVAKAAELVSAYTRVYLQTEGVKKPAISSACPVILRLISLRFPSLEEHVIHMLPPMEIAAKLAKSKAAEIHPELSADEKNAISHRGRALAEVQKCIQGFTAR